MNFLLTFAFAASNYFPAKVHPQSTIDRSIADTPWSQSEQQSEEYVEDGDENEDDSLHASFTHKHTLNNENFSHNKQKFAPNCSRYKGTKAHIIIETLKIGQMDGETDK